MTTPATMASHFQCIGFEFSGGEADIFEMIDRIVTNGSRRPTSRGDYVPWNAGMGAEAWVQLDGMNVLGLIPHFSGVSRIRCVITNEVPRESPSPLDAALHAWVNPMGPEATGEYPVVFDCPDYYTQPVAAFPHQCHVQFALFPEQISMFADEHEFSESQRDRPAKFASQSLIPSGLFGEGPPRSEVVACGKVVKTELMTNALTRVPFLAAQFDTLGGVFDLVLPVADDSKNLRHGNIIMGTFWISGRVLRSGGPPPLPKV